MNYKASSSTVINYINFSLSLIFIITLRDRLTLLFAKLVENLKFTVIMIKHNFFYLLMPILLFLISP